jgi:tetratricopeptide (TPR) repeat protein
VSLRRLALLPISVSPEPPDGALEQAGSGLPDSEALAGADRIALAQWLNGDLAEWLASCGALELLRVEIDDADASEEPPDATASEADGEGESNAVQDELLTPEAIAETARAVAADLALACALSADARAVELTGLLVDSSGEERLRLTLGASLGAAHLLPQRLTRELLLSLGEDGSAPEPPSEEEIDVAALLALCRGAQALVDAARTPESDDAQTLAASGRARFLRDPSTGIAELLEAITLAPTLTSARDLLLRSAHDAAGGPWMPAWLAALERLSLLLPGTIEVLTALADYRLLHGDRDGAHELLLQARDLADDGEQEAQLLGRLASLAEQDGRTDEAEQHLRAATRLADDPSLHLRLGLLLAAHDPAESVRSLQRAVVLAPDRAGGRLALARQLRAQGEFGRAATEAARAAQLAHDDPGVAQSAAALLRELIERAES